MGKTYDTLFPMERNYPLVSTREAAHELGVTPAHVTRMVAAGELTPAVKAPGLRGAFMFTKEEVEQARVMRDLQTAGKA